MDLPEEETIECMHCAADPRRINNKTIDNKGDHVFSCNQTGQGGARGRRNTRHTTIVYRSAAFFKKNARGAEIEVEPNIDFPVKAGVNRDNIKKTTGDIRITRNGVSTMLDVRVAFPSTFQHPIRAREAGHAAKSGQVAKFNEYKQYKIPQGRFVPLAIETGGRMHKDMREYICTYIKQGISMQDFKEWSPAEKALYSKSVGHFLTGISVALTTSNAINLIKHGKEVALYR
jgi:hypothetical protein